MGTVPLASSPSRDALWVVAGRLVGMGATIAGNVLAARWLGPAEFGVFLLISTVMALGSILAMGGLNEAGLRLVSTSLALGQGDLAAAYRRRILSWAVATSLLAAACVAAGLAEYEAWLGQLRQTLWLVGLAALGVVLLAWQQITAELLRGWNALRWASLFSGGQAGGPLSNLVFLALLLAVARSQPAWTAELALALLVAATAVTLPLSLWGLHRVASGEDAAPHELSPLQRRELRRAAGTLMLIQLLTFAIYQLDIWLGGWWLAPHELGLYGAAKRCQLLAQLPVQMAMLTVLSAVPRLYAQGRLADLERTVRTATTWAAVPSLAALALLVAAPSAILTLAFGESYAEAAAVVWPLAAGQLVHTVLGNPAYVLTMTGRQGLVLRLNALAAVAIAAGGSLGAAWGGPAGLAAGAGGAVALQNIALWWLARRELGVWTHLGWRRATAPRPLAAVPALRPARAATAPPPAAPLTRLWWLHPVWPFAGIVSTTIVAAWLQSEPAYLLYGTPKYVQLTHVVMGLAAVAVFALGAYLAETTWSARSAPVVRTSTVRMWFYASTALTLFGYLVWFAVGFRNGFSLDMIGELLFADDEGIYNTIRQELFPTIPGVTTCTQFGVAALLLGAWLFVHGERRIIWPLLPLVGLAGLRAVLFSERTALLELCFPLLIVGLRVWGLGRVWPAWVRQSLLAAPVAGAVGLVAFFGVFEYFRSWKYYQEDFSSYAEFTAWRLSGYFTTAHNNGAMALVTEQPRPLPYFTLRPLWEFPGLRDSPLGYEQLTGVDVPAAHLAMLERYGTVELNNEGGLFQPALDFGWAGFLLYWCGYGFVATRVYRSFLTGSLTGFLLYPLLYMSLLETPLILFLFYTRTFPPLVTLLAVSWLARRPASAGAPVAVAVAAEA